MSRQRRDIVRFAIGLFLAVAGVVCARAPEALGAVCPGSVAMHGGRVTALTGLVVIMLTLRRRAMARTPH